MEEKIYYAKIIFESFDFMRPNGLDNWNILLNVAMKELAFERLEWSGGKEKVVKNYAIQMTDEDIIQLLPYINALEFEPYRNVDDSQYFMIYDGPTLKFIGITDSYLPLYQHYIYFVGEIGEERPYEKLFSYIVNKYLSHLWGNALLEKN